MDYTFTIINKSRESLDLEIYYESLYKYNKKYELQEFGDYDYVNGIMLYKITESYYRYVYKYITLLPNEKYVITQSELYLNQNDYIGAHSEKYSESAAIGICYNNYKGFLVLEVIDDYLSTTTYNSK